MDFEEFKARYYLTTITTRENLLLRLEDDYFRNNEYFKSISAGEIDPDQKKIKYYQSIVTTRENFLLYLEDNYFKKLYFEQNK